MKNISDEKKQEIIKVLQQKGVNRPCPKCNYNDFTLLDGYFNQVIQQELNGITSSGPAVPFIQQELNGITSSGPTVPSVVIVCTNCGYISQHALGVLDLIPVEEKKLN